MYARNICLPPPPPLKRKISRHVNRGDMETDMTSTANHPQHLVLLKAKSPLFSLVWSVNCLRWHSWHMAERSVAQNICFFLENIASILRKTGLYLFSRVTRIISDKNPNTIQNSTNPRNKCNILKCDIKHQMLKINYRSGNRTPALFLVMGLFHSSTRLMLQHNYSRLSLVCAITLWQNKCTYLTRLWQSSMQFHYWNSLHS